MQRTLARSTSRPHPDRLQHDVAVDVAAGEKVDVGEPELGPRVDAQMRLGEQEHARDRAVRKGVELLADDGRAAGVCRGTQDAAQLVRVGQNGGVAHPRVHRVEAHRLGCVLRERRPGGPAVELEQSVSFAEVGAGRRPGDGELERSAARRSGQATPEKGAELHSHQDAPPSTVA